MALLTANMSHPPSACVGENESEDKESTGDNIHIAFLTIRNSSNE